MGHENILPSGDTYFDPEIMEGMIRETFGPESETTGATSSDGNDIYQTLDACLLYTSPSPRD